VSATVVILDPLFDADGAAAMVDLCERFGSYRVYGEHEPLDSEIGHGMAQRHDALTNFIRTGGYEARQEPPEALAARTSYFREEYAYGPREHVEGIGPFLHHEGFMAAARTIHGRPVIEPAIAYANLMVPGQELAMHTDVPEFRGANRKVVPQWLLVVMHHSGLFDEYRMPIATTIAYFVPPGFDGGALAYWPNGADGEVERHQIRYNTAIVLDTDSTFHGVLQVADVATAKLPPIRRTTTLDFIGDHHWALRSADGDEIARYDWSAGEVRFSVSWKAYSFRDEAERDAWRTHSDDLTLDRILDALVDDLVARGRVDADVARDPALGELLIDEYVRFPTSKAGR
jgi:hypothetical protein